MQKKWVWTSALTLGVVLQMSVMRAQVPAEIAKQLEAIRAALAAIEALYEPPPPPDPPPVLVTMAVIVSDFHIAESRIAGATVEVDGVVIGQSNADGYLETIVTLGVQHDIRVSKAGYEDGTASDILTENKQVGVALIKIKPPHPNPILGRLRINGAFVTGGHPPGCFADDTGCLNPVGAHAGDLFYLFAKDRARALLELDRIAAAGYQFVRVWMQLGCGADQPCTEYNDDGWRNFWYGHEVGPGLTPNYWGQVHDFLVALHERGLKLAWSQGDPAQTGHTMTDRRAYAARAAQTAAGVDSGMVVAFFDAGNEAWQNDQDRFYDDPKNMASFVRAYQDAGGLGLVTLTDAPEERCYGTNYSFEAYAIPPTMIWDVHSWRDGHSWDLARHPWTIAYECKPKWRLGINSEPPGNGELVSVTPNKHELDHEALGNIAVLSVIGHQAFTWFSGEGVKLDRGLQVEQGFANVPGAIGLLPKDVMRWTQLHHSGSTWGHLRVFELTPNPSVRVDGVMNDDGRFAYMMHGPGGTHRFPVARSFKGTICNTGTLECHPLERKAGEHLDVTFIRGRLIQGTVQ